MKSAVARNPILAYLALAFVFSWAVYIPMSLLNPSLLTAQPLGTALGAYGPALSAFLVTFLLAGKDGLSAFLHQAFRWRVGLRWYLAAFLIMPLVVIIARGGYRLFYADVPLGPLGLAGSWSDWAYLFFSSLVFGPLGEEFGWRGFLLPRLQARMNAFLAGLGCGLFWALWQLPVFMTAARVLGYGPIVWFVLGGLALTLLYTWVFNSTGASVLLTILFSTSTAFTFSFMGAGTLRLYPILVVVLWITVAQVALIFGFGGSRKRQS